ncbi:hypothetical protein [Mesorhizobium sp. M0800]|uniref:hypothetical protein n=1 Tax=Mesorhizobium sp. M0800 TaxID=2957000 RepID=UPI0033358851
MTTTSSTPANAAAAALPTPPTGTPAQTPVKAAPAAIQTPLATTRTTPAPVTPEEAKAAATLMKMLVKVLPRFAELYDIAGHEVFRKAMAEALKQAGNQSAPEKLAA